MTDLIIINSVIRRKSKRFWLINIILCMIEWCVFARILVAEIFRKKKGAGGYVCARAILYDCILILIYFKWVRSGYWSGKVWGVRFWVHSAPYSHSHSLSKGDTSRMGWEQTEEGLLSLNVFLQILSILYKQPHNQIKCVILLFWAEMCLLCGWDEEEGGGRRLETYHFRWGWCVCVLSCCVYCFI